MANPQVEGKGHLQITAWPVCKQQVYIEECCYAEGSSAKCNVLSGTPTGTANRTAGLYMPRTVHIINATLQVITATYDPVAITTNKLETRASSVLCLHVHAFQIIPGDEQINKL